MLIYASFGIGFWPIAQNFSSHLSKSNWQASQRPIRRPITKDTTSNTNQDISQDDSQDDNKPNLAQTDQQPNPNQPTTAQNLDLTNQDKLDFLYQSDKEPSLYQILQAEFAYNRQDIPLALQLYKGESFAKNSTAVFERALALSMQYENPQNSLMFAKAWQKPTMSIFLRGFM